MKGGLFIFGFLILLVTEVARVYFIMPFPGSQQANTIELAYFIQSHLGLLRLTGLLIILWPLYELLKTGSRGLKLAVAVLLFAYLAVFYLFNFKFLAEKMFYQPTKTVLSSTAENKIKPYQLVLGVTVNGESKAYPIEVIGYHHQVRDVVGGKNIMITYCTVCRTGRAFLPEVDGQPETFRLVGMDHFNAMFEDSRTKSWWRQVNGEAIAGKLKGKSLVEIPSEQMKLGAWLLEHPNSLIMQEDSVFRDQYFGMRNFDEGRSKGSLTRRDSLSWKDKSWVIGVTAGEKGRAYDWNELVRDHVINDELDGLPLVVTLDKDTASFHAFNRVIGNDTLTFTFDAAKDQIRDDNTGSTWDAAGHSTDGPLKGAHLTTVQSYQEFWHSWRTFHPGTTKYDNRIVVKKISRKSV